MAGRWVDREDDALAKAMWTACCFGRTEVAHLLLKVGKYGT